MGDKIRVTNKEPRQSTEASEKAGALADEEVKIVELIVFNLGEEEFAADIDQVREIIRIGIITPIPDSPNFIKGVTNVRGEITVVIDLKERFFLPIKKEIETKHIVITEQENNLFGLMVDEVTEVLRIPENDVKPTPELVTRIDRIYVRGVITLENRLIIFIDLAKVLEEEELTKLAKLTEKHRVGKKTKEQKIEAKQISKLHIDQKETTEIAEKAESVEKNEKAKTN